MYKMTAQKQELYSDGIQKIKIQRSFENGKRDLNLQIENFQEEIHSASTLNKLIKGGNR